VRRRDPPPSESGSSLVSVRRAIVNQEADAASRPRPEKSTFAVAYGAFADFAGSETVILYKRPPWDCHLSGYAVPQTVNSTPSLSLTADVEFCVVFDSCSWHMRNSRRSTRFWTAMGALDVCS
jgi:hypothetical protein